ncbi:hypothetical protein [Burkholderia phage BCSR129]|nr:hypothetical protein [Burkholderia phage BCSR129]
MRMLRRGELLYWHNGEWMDPEQYRAQEKVLEKERRAPMVKHLRANNWYNKLQQKAARQRKGRQAMAERTAKNKKRVAAFDDPAKVYESITAAAAAHGVSVQTARRWMRKGTLVEVVDSE